MQNLTIIMYHYVRPIAKSYYPLIKGLELDSFKTQLNYLEKNYEMRHYILLLYNLDLT